MDSKHRLEAPHNDSLNSIEQVPDRSGMSGLYPQAHDQWTGELVGKEERDEHQQHDQDTMSFGARKQFFAIGFLIPLPVVLAGLFAGAILTYMDEDKVPLFVVPAIFFFFIWSALTFLTAKKIHRIFYNNALQAAPYVIMLLILLTISGLTFYHLTEPVHQHVPMYIAAYVGAAILAWSVLLSFFLIRLWTTPVLNGNLKVLIIAVLALVLLGGGIYCWM